MDARQFDALARTLAAPKTRRGLLGSLAALAAGLVGARSADAQVSQAQCGNTSCKNNPGKCPPGCVCCVYGNGNSRCRPPGDCSGTVVSPTTTAAPTTTTTTAAPTTTTTTAAPTTTTTTAAPCADRTCAGGTCAIANQTCCSEDLNTATCTGSSTSNCYCVTTTEGTKRCHEGGQDCGQFGACTSSATCPAGTFCSNTAGVCQGFCLGGCAAAAALALQAADATGERSPER